MPRLPQRDCKVASAYPISTSRKPRLTILATHPVQYYAPVYRCLAERAAIELHVIYLSDAGAAAYQDPGFGRAVQWDVPLLEGYGHEILKPGASVTTHGFWSQHAPGLTAALDRARPDWLLIYGYTNPMNWVAARWARRHNVRIAYTSDSNSRNPERLVIVKKLVIGKFFRRIDLYLSPSESNLEYLLKYGAKRERIWRMPFAIEIARFTPAPERVEAARHYDFLWAGKCIPRKRGQDFIAALAMLARRSKTPINACMVGDGPCRNALAAQAQQLPAHCQVDFAGFVNQQDMPRMLQSAHIFAFTSEREPYGLAATEAAAAGMALVVADDCGCVGDTALARPSVNALSYRPGDVPGLAAAMETLQRNPARRTQMQQASLDIAKSHDVTCAAQVIERSITANETT